MGFSDTRTPSGPRSVVAVAAVVCVLAAVLGCWLLRFDHAASDTASSPTSLSAVHSDNAHLDHHASSPSGHAPVKSAGLHRDRPPTELHVMPASLSSLSADSESVVWSWPGGNSARAPATDRFGQHLLTQFCIARC
ncbi:hypothetical protein [Mycobacterium sp.]|uniref:hypothetical protein n=1 Tax=Mycobacterium sp. TaxID=1785 RepID=UPI003D6BD84B